MQEYDLAVVGIFWGAAIAFALSAIFERNEQPLVSALARNGTLTIGPYAARFLTLGELRGSAMNPLKLSITCLFVKLVQGSADRRLADRLIHIDVTIYLSR